MHDVVSRRKRQVDFRRRGVFIFMDFMRRLLDCYVLLVLGVVGLPSIRGTWAR